MPNALYRPLDGSRDEVRLLRLSSSLSMSQEWELEIYSLDACPPFAALSYLWGKDAKTSHIAIHGKSIPITPNLACALDHVEHHWQSQFATPPATEFRLWTDAVCIHQDDTREREQQVKLMGRIYATTEIVMGSLGPLTEAISLSITTLHLAHAEIRQIPDDASMEQNLHWLQKFPHLTDADVGHPEDQFDANKSWKLLREFLYMDYWRRAWVVQELVLAKRLLFFSEKTSLDPAALFSTLHWVQTTKRIAKTQDVDAAVRRPDWLIPSVWSFLTYENLLGWKAVLRIDSARNDDRDGRLYRLTLACAGNDLRATDPRDLIYGTMALTRMGLEPDYSHTSSLGTLCAEFMTWWLDEVTVLHSEDGDWTFNHLDLLGDAGVGQVADDDEHHDLERSIPSWAPNFALHAKKYAPHILRAQQNADARIFPDDAPLPRVENLSLFVPVVLLDKVVRVDTVKHVKSRVGLLEYVVAHCRRHPTYPTGCAPLQAISRTLMKDILGESDNPDDRDVMIRFFGFLRAICHGPETGVLPAKPQEALEKLGLSTRSDILFAESMRKVYFSNLDPETVEWTKEWLVLLLRPAWDGEWASPAVLDLCLRTVLEIRELDYTSIAETKDGYLVVAPVGTKVADHVCLMNGRDAASVIRERSGYWQHIGQCYSFGLSDNRSDEFGKSIPDYVIADIR